MKYIRIKALYQRAIERCDRGHFFGRLPRYCNEIHSPLLYPRIFVTGDGRGSAPNRKTGRSACISSLADRNAIHDCAMLSLRGGSLPRRWRRRWSAHGCGRWRGRMIDGRWRWSAHGCGRWRGRMIDGRWRWSAHGCGRWRGRMIDGRWRRSAHGRGRWRGRMIDGRWRRSAHGRGRWSGRMIDGRWRRSAHGRGRWTAERSDFADAATAPATAPRP